MIKTKQPHERGGCKKKYQYKKIKHQSAEKFSQMLKALRFFMCISSIYRNLNFLGNKNPRHFRDGD